MPIRLARETEGVRNATDSAHVPRPYDDCVTARRSLGTGPQPAHSIRAAQADLLDALPGVHLPDLDELRARGVLGMPTTTPPASRRTLGPGGRADEEPSVNGQLTRG
ncbi:hypothetical protein GCM10010303_83250 [Streptomyces purpurascens]|nr:hypothetical protein GCM10010303_83250 [Streptomyces purpurascens]